MKNISFAIMSVGALALSSCSSMFNNDVPMVETSYNFEVSAEDIVFLAVSTALGKNPSTYEDFSKVEEVLRMMTADGVIDSNVIKMQIDGALDESSIKNKQLVSKAFDVVLKYFNNRYKDVFDSQEAYDVVVAIADGINYALELHVITNGEINKL